VRVGLVSDTHGLFDPKLADVLRGVDLVLHAGDVVRASVLDALAAIAPVRAVRGNNDEGPTVGALPGSAVVALGPLVALVVHDLGPPGRPHRAAAALVARHRPQIVVHGHSHRPGHAVQGGVLFVNPGSCGPRRFSLPRAAALLEVRGHRVEVRFVDLAPDPPAPLGEPVAVLLRSR
jgi:putative phosphoesterase